MNELAKGKYGEWEGMRAEIRTIWGEPILSLQHGSISVGLILPTENINKAIQIYCISSFLGILLLVLHEKTLMITLHSTYYN